ncbi:hypothetical protein [Kitasatospora sp. CB01950]|uniref:hypothetical protein n=1 Tax=Kitasatospora sp. CB01950 TaxID=1703930 RepID=UPI00093D3078|nr:hypothetical protein [Kitasatospora sp. CB01950]
MAAISPPAFQQAGSYSARVDRLSVLSAMLQYPGTSGRATSPISIADGVKPSYQNSRLKVAAQSTPNMSVQLTSGWAYVQNDDVAAYGAYVVVNDGTISIPIGASSGSQYRIDTIVAQVLDAETLGTANSASFEVVSGPYAASRAAAQRGTIPPNAAIIADVYVDAGVSSITNTLISDARSYTVASGGIQPVTSTTDLDNGHPGQVRYRTDTDTFVYTNLAGTTIPLLQSQGAATFGQITVRRKTADRSLSNTSGLQDDNDLLFASLPAGAVYIVEGFLIYSADSNADIRIGFAGPTSATFSWNISGQDGSQTGSTAPIILDCQDITSTAYTLGGRGAGGKLVGKLDGLLTISATSGTFKCQWAQQTANAASTVMHAGSYIRLTRVA